MRWEGRVWASSGRRGEERGVQECGPRQDRLWRVDADALQERGRGATKDWGACAHLPNAESGAKLCPGTWFFDLVRRSQVLAPSSWGGVWLAWGSRRSWW